MTKFDDQELPHSVDIEVNAESNGSGELIPVELKNFQLPTINGQPAKPESFLLVKLNKQKTPVVFDPDKKGNSAYAVPFRFDPEYENSSPLPSTNPRRGRLIFLTHKQTGQQHYRLFFDTKPQTKSYHGMIGDGDIFTMKKGRLSVSGMSSPVYYGTELFGVKGMLVGASYKNGLHFFEELNEGADYINRGRLLDKNGQPINGIPHVCDFNGSGTLDILIGTNNGELLIAENIGKPGEPCFSPPTPLLCSDSSPLSVIKYIKDLKVKIINRQGKNPEHYKEIPVVYVHGSKVHVFTCPSAVDLTGSGRLDLLVGCRGNRLLYFQRDKNGKFLEARTVIDEKGDPIQSGGFIYPVPVPDGKITDVIDADILGNFRHLKLISIENNIPVFRDCGQLEVEPAISYGFPYIAEIAGEKVMLTGDIYGQVRAYSKHGKGPTDFKGEARYLEMSNASISRYMPRAVYEDINGDGIKELISGDITGKIYFYANIGTNKQPYFDRAIHLQTKTGPIKITGGPDPRECDDGYSKVELCDLSGNGYPDILSGSGFGEIYIWRNQGPDKNGLPVLDRPEILHDISGNPIKCHHMSAVLACDWDGNGITDLIVGGQTKVHNHPDDDPDLNTQVRWYRGRKKVDGSIEFLPYVPLEAEGDRIITYRPIPSWCGIIDGIRHLVISIFLFKQPDPNQPQKIEFVKYLPIPLKNGREDITKAYFSIAEPIPNDSVIIQGSCIGSLFAFRTSFVANNGYLPAKIKVEKTSYSSENLIISRSWQATEKCRLPQTKNNRQNQEAKSFTMFESGKDKILGDCTFEYTENAFIIKLNCPEPDMDRRICRGKYRNAPIECDDGIVLLLTDDLQAEFFYKWFINSNGFYKEMRIRSATGEHLGPWRFGNGDITVNVIQSDVAWSLEIIVPFTKINNAKPEKLFCSIQRNRYIYAGETRASEQKLIATASLPDKPFSFIEFS